MAIKKNGNISALFQFIKADLRKEKLSYATFKNNIFGETMTKIPRNTK